MWKIAGVFLMSLMVFLCSGCGTPNSNTSQLPESDTMQVQDSESEQIQEEIIITISEMLVNSDTKSVCIKGFVNSDEEITMTDYMPVGIQVQRLDTEPVDGGYSVCWYGFYGDEAVLSDIRITDSFGSEGTVPVNNEAERVETEAKKFEVSAGTGTVPVWITEFAVMIAPQEDWREYGAFYNVIASDEKGERKLLCQLPSMDDRKPSEIREHPLVNDAAENMETLGGGFSSAMEQEHCGICYIMNETIDLDDVNSIEVEYIY